MKKTIICSAEKNKNRIDQFISSEINISRNQVTKLIEKNLILKNNLIVKKPAEIIFENDKIDIFEKTEIKIKNPGFNPEIIYFDENIIAINKPPFISVHSPNKENTEFTILDWIKETEFVSNDLKNDEDRYGIVHRIDKETSGILLIARNKNSFNELLNMFKNRNINKTYIAVSNGIPKENNGIIKKKIIRDPLNPTRMTYSNHQGRESITEYKVKKISIKNNFTVFECFPKTGRTHQIRVHLSSIGNYIIGDKVYGKSSDIISRQALHANKIEFTLFDKKYNIEAEIPNDIKIFLDGQ